MPNEISVVFHNGSNYDYHFIKELANKCEGQFEGLGLAKFLWTNNNQKSQQLIKTVMKVLQLYLTK